MANQGSRPTQGGGGQQDRDREGNLGQSGGGSNPTGTSGRHDENRSGDTEAGRKRRNNSPDDDSPLGTRNTNR
jgi:hypothetical protein